ncbi:MAG: AAA family ATPase [Desulfobacteraceae bacterium]|nr:AAA family ATPase [Desulfobacteraceae bacterium]
MIEKISIKNYKSIKTLEFKIGRVNVLIGENGCGKTNILEAIGLISAAAEDKLDNEFLANRGIRVSEAIFMRSAFDELSVSEPIEISVFGGGTDFKSTLQNDNKPYSKWKNGLIAGNKSELINYLNELEEKGQIKGGDEITPDIFKGFINKKIKNLDIKGYMIYSPENKALRTFDKEGQIEPLGINGEGLLKLLKFYKVKNDEKLIQIKKELELIDWFGDLDLPEDMSDGDTNLRIKDRYIHENLPFFSQKNVNEGFLFLLFYVTLFINKETPSFFAIDNIEASLNPKLCTELIKKIAVLSEKYNKQVIMTSHNPAILDGFNLNDPMQKIFVVSRNKLGHTRIREIKKPETAENEEPVKLSEAFLNGMLG